MTEVFFRPPPPTLSGAYFRQKATAAATFASVSLEVAWILSVRNIFKIQLFSYTKHRITLAIIKTLICKHSQGPLDIKHTLNHQKRHQTTQKIYHNLHTCDNAEQTEFCEGKLALPPLHIKFRHYLICHQSVDTKRKIIKFPINLHMI